MTTNVGRVLNGRYRLVRPVGHGAQASVWIAEHLALTTQVAIKLIDPELAKRPDARERFRREATAAAQLRSAHVVQILDHGIDEDQPFIAMELLDGEDLFERLDQRGRLSLRETAKIVTQVARALARAHAAGVVHRDLKPENIFLVSNEDDEVAKVLDFGVAKVSEMQRATQATRAGQLIGTPHYMSPEQVKGLTEVDYRTDLWALGIIAYQCVVGSLPFDSEGVGDLLLKVTMGEIPIPSRELAGLPASFDAWFAKACARLPEDRFDSARALADALAQIAMSTTDPGAPPGRESSPGGRHTSPGAWLDDADARPSLPTQTGLGRVPPPPVSSPSLAAQAGAARAPAPSASQAGAARAPAPSASQAGAARAPAPSASHAGAARAPAPPISSPSLASQAGAARAPAPPASRSSAVVAPQAVGVASPFKLSPSARPPSHLDAYSGVLDPFADEDELPSDVDLEEAAPVGAALVEEVEAPEGEDGEELAVADDGAIESFAPWAAPDPAPPVAAATPPVAPASRAWPASAIDGSEPPLAPFASAAPSGAHRTVSGVSSSEMPPELDGSRKRRTVRVVALVFGAIAVWVAWTAISTQLRGMSPAPGQVPEAVSVQRAPIVPPRSDPPRQPVLDAGPDAAAAVDPGQPRPPVKPEPSRPPTSNTVQKPLPAKAGVEKRKGDDLMFDIPEPAPE